MDPCRMAGLLQVAGGICMGMCRAEMWVFAIDLLGPAMLTVTCFDFYP